MVEGEFLTTAAAPSAEQAAVARSPIGVSDAYQVENVAVRILSYNEINGRGSWEINPSVCAVTFIVHKCNIDEVLDRRACASNATVIEVIDYTLLPEPRVKP